MIAPPARAAVLAGVGLAGTFDEIVFHQLLRWHHLYVGEGPSVGRISDGVLHTFSTVALVAGVVLLVRDWDGDVRRAAGWVLAGFGGFNVFDGTVDHKLLRLHQVREGVPDTLPYDVVWIAASLAVLLVGLWLGRGRRDGAAPAGRREEG